MDSYDLIVIGAGPGGYVAAIRAAQLGHKVAVIEREVQLGGTCLRVGCIPSKALLESSHHYAHAKKSLRKHGILMDNLQLDLPAMQKRKNQVVSMLTKGVESLFRKNQVTAVPGQATLTAPDRVRVQSESGDQELTAPAILIATGSQPTAIPQLPTDGERIVTSTEALAWETVPEHLVVIGGGYIGLELGSVWSRLGAAVTVVEACDRILPGMDHELAAEAQRLLTRQGLKFQLDAGVQSVTRQGDQCTVTLANGHALEADRVLVAVGRRPNTANLGLEALGVALDERGAIPVNEQFATSIPGLYAIGDVIPGPMLAHKAEEEGVAFAEQLILGEGSMHYDAIPGVVYTQPEIASIGQTEQQLVEAGTAFKKAGFPYRANGRARATDQTDGFAKLLTDESNQKILGAHLIGAHAGDLINEVAVVIRHGLSPADLAQTCHAHPTFGEVLKEAALATEERALHS